MSDATPSRALSVSEATQWLTGHSLDAMALVDMAQAGEPIATCNLAFSNLTAYDLNAVARLGLPAALGIDDKLADWAALLAQCRSGLAGQFQCRAYKHQREPFWAHISAHPLLEPLTPERTPQRTPELTPEQALALQHPLAQPQSPSLPGSQPHAQASASLPATEQPPRFALVTVRNASAEWLATQALRLHLQNNESLFAMVSDAVLRANSALVINAINPVAQTLTGWSASEAIGRPVNDVVHLFHAKTGSAIGNPLLRALLTGEALDWTENILLQRSDGSRIPVTYCTSVIRDPNGTVVEGYLLMRNTSEASVITDSMAHLATRDALTGLLNQSVFVERLEQATALARRHQHQCAMVFAEVDDLPALVERYGQDTVDELLQALSARLSTIFRKSDTVCRTDQARFGVVLPVITPESTSEHLRQKALEAAEQPVLTKAHQLNAVLRVGVAMYPHDGDDTTALSNCALARLKH